MGLIALNAPTAGVPAFNMTRRPQPIDGVIHYSLEQKLLPLRGRKRRIRRHHLGEPRSALMADAVRR